jgi:hypothetical protein
MPRLIDITGQRFGRLAVTKKAASATNGKKQTRWECRCDCGETVTVWKTALTSGTQVSCGCYMRERARETVIKRATTHGMKHSSEYSVWCGMKRRCLNPNDKSYPRYGGRGIRVLFSGFADFYSEVGPRPGLEFSIDRIDTNGHYAPGNVRWATGKQQCRNKLKSIKVSIDGVERPLKDWCEERGLDYRNVWQRIKVLGWPVERALQ